MKEKLRFCEKFIRENGYPDAEILRNDGSEMIIFHVQNVTAKYPNERPSVSVGFAEGAVKGMEIGYDVMQILCFVASGVPKDRLEDIQKFCSDFNKSMQIGHFGTDLKNESVYFRCSQLIPRGISEEMLGAMFDQLFTMVLFYFGYAYEILIELSYGIIGYGGTSRRLQERKQMLNKAMAELKGQPEPEPEKDSIQRNLVVEELLAQLKQTNPEILEKADIDLDQVRRKQGKTKKQASAEDAAMKILDLAQNEKKSTLSAKASRRLPETAYDEPDNEISRSTVSDHDSARYRNQMPSVEMYTRKEARKPEPPLDMEELRRALAVEQKERSRIQNLKSQTEDRLNQEIFEKNAASAQELRESTKKESSDSLVQRLRSWTQK
ncbi:MAG: hypothetical protein ACI4VM_07555 [Anaerovoracaceae bacterium]